MFHPHSYLGSQIKSYLCKSKHTAIMKKLLSCIALSFCLSIACVMAQPQHSHASHGPQHPHQVQPLKVQFKASNREDFTIYIDGDKVKDRQRKGILSTDILPGQHEVIIVLNRPEEKAKSFAFTPISPNTTFIVAIEPRTHQVNLLIETPHGPKPFGEEKVSYGIAQPQTPTKGEMDAIIAKLNRENFENNRLSLAKELVSTQWFTTTQIMQLSNTFSFENNKLDFLMYAYEHCVDPEHYESAEDLLQFQSNRKTLREFLKKNR